MRGRHLEYRKKSNAASASMGQQNAKMTNIISISLRHVLMGRGLAKQNAKVNFLVTHTIINVAQHFGCDTREYLQET